MNTILYLETRERSNISDFFVGIRDVTEPLGIHVQLIETPPDAKHIEKLVDFWDPLGIIINCGRFSNSRINAQNLHKRPCVYIDSVPGELPSTSLTVFHNSFATGFMAAKELLKSGYEHLACIPYPCKRYWSDERMRGFCEAARLNGLTPQTFSFPSGDDFASAVENERYQRKLRHFVDSLSVPCGIFAANDETCEIVLAATRYLGKSVPDEIGIVGVDNSKDICERTTPMLSSIAPDFRGGGRTAAILLMKAINKEKIQANSRVQFFEPLHLVHRESLKNLSVFDEKIAEALRRIDADSTNGLTAREILSSFPCSRTFAEKMFRKATGKSILEAIQEQRLKRAKELLQKRTVQLKVISNFCGFKNANSLRKFFLSKTGMTMSQWRKEICR
jgi:LacI family transcriptional regulator